MSQNNLPLHVIKYYIVYSFFFQVSGISFAFDPEKGAGRRVDPSFIKIGDEYLDPERKYRMVTKGYLAHGKDGYDMLAKCEQVIIIYYFPGWPWFFQSFLDVFQENIMVIPKTLTVGSILTQEGTFSWVAHNITGQVWWVRIGWLIQIAVENSNGNFPSAVFCGCWNQLTWFLMAILISWPSFPWLLASVDLFQLDRQYCGNPGKHSIGWNIGHWQWPSFSQQDTILFQRNEILSFCLQLIDEENGPTLAYAVQNHFAALAMREGRTRRASVHHQSLVTLSRK